MVDYTSDTTKADGVTENWSGDLRYVVRHDDGRFKSWRPRTAADEQQLAARTDGGDVGVTLPDEPDLDVYEFVKETSRWTMPVTVKATMSETVEWTLTYESKDDKELSGTATLGDRGRLRFRSGTEWIAGKKTKGLTLPRSVEDSLSADLDAVAEYREAKREASRERERQTELLLTVEEIEYTTGTYRTKYHNTGRVLTTNKSRYDDEEETLMDALERELGTTDGRLSADSDENPLAGIDEGTTLSVEEVAEIVGVGEALAEIRAEEKHAERVQELRDEHEALEHVSFDPDAVEEGLAEAAKTGEHRQVAKRIDQCRDSNVECSVDQIHYRATPEGQIVKSRNHTY